MSGMRAYNFKRKLLQMYTAEFFQVFTVVNNKKLTLKKQYRYHDD